MKYYCDTCKAYVINGIPCHEAWCPDAHIDPTTGAPYVVECNWCGVECEMQRGFRKGITHVFCSDDCAASYWM